MYGTSGGMYGSSSYGGGYGSGYGGGYGSTGYGGYGSTGAYGGSSYGGYGGTGYGGYGSSGYGGYGGGLMSRFGGGMYGGAGGVMGGLMGGGGPLGMGGMMEGTPMMGQDGRPIIGPDGQPVMVGPDGRPLPPGAGLGGGGPWGRALRAMHGVMGFFGRLSFLVDENTHALHFFISALLQVPLFFCVCVWGGGEVGGGPPWGDGRPADEYCGHAPLFPATGALVCVGGAFISWWEGGPFSGGGATCG